MIGCYLKPKIHPRVFESTPGCDVLRGVVALTRQRGLKYASEPLIRPLDIATWPPLKHKSKYCSTHEAGQTVAIFFETRERAKLSWLAHHFLIAYWACFSSTRSKNSFPPGFTGIVFSGWRVSIQYCNCSLFIYFYLLYLFIYLFVCLFVCLFVYLFVRSFVGSFVRSVDCFCCLLFVILLPCCFVVLLFCCHVVWLFVVCFLLFIVVFLRFNR